MKIKVEDIECDPDVQPRATMDGGVVSDYAELMKEGVVFPLVIVFFDGTTNWLADGFHRVYAAEEIGLEEIEADVREGSKRDATLFAVGTNATHGARRTNADKRRVVTLILNDDEWRTKSNVWIAEKCSVSHTFVQNMRPTVQPASVAGSPERRTGRDGKTRSLPGKLEWWSRPGVTYLGMLSHPAADLMPPMTPTMHARLVGSMRKLGFLAWHPITMHEGMILDGRNRLKAAKEAGVTPIFTEWDGWPNGDPWDFVWSMNMERTHLSEDRIACIELDLDRAKEAARMSTASLENAP